ncbi:FxsA family protein [Corynebacterium sp. NML130628]|uniref:FxsA family protein n=1 Tax=Corynebacterium sp. NML130628 TaxID=1906333 RepID=UPI0008FAF1E3|nr:FxsA family protein [Corynebacterium sp. NML130628]OIR45734.1 hypothetical protein BJP07_04730 [Corynebacterium sp. NML130628]
MPIYILTYFLVEALAFFLVAKAIGVGWALLAIFALMILGGALATLTLRGELAKAARGRTSMGKLAGDSALLMVGWAFCIIPGFMSSLLGLLLIFTPTRSLFRNHLSRSLRQRIESFGIKMYESTPMSRNMTTYGSFSQPTPEQGFSEDEHPVIDTDEIEDWLYEEHKRRKERGDEGTQS